MAPNSELKSLTKADARALLRKEASFFLTQKTAEERKILRTAANVSFVIQEHHDEVGLVDMHADIFGGLNRLKQEYLTKAGTFLTSYLTKYTSLQEVTTIQMASSDLKWKQKMSQTPCKFYKKGICKNGHSCPYLHGKGKTQKRRVDTSKNLNLDPPKSKSEITAEHIAPMRQQITTLLESVEKLNARWGETAAVTNILKEEYCRQMTQRLGIPYTISMVDPNNPGPEQQDERGHASFRGRHN